MLEKYGRRAAGPIQKKVAPPGLSRVRSQHPANYSEARHRQRMEGVRLILQNLSFRSALIDTGVSPAPACSTAFGLFETGLRPPQNNAPRRVNVVRITLEARSDEAPPQRKRESETRRDRVDATIAFCRGRREASRVDTPRIPNDVLFPTRFRWILRTSVILPSRRERLATSFGTRWQKQGLCIHAAVSPKKNSVRTPSRSRAGRAGAPRRVFRSRRGTAPIAAASDARSETLPVRGGSLRRDRTTGGSIPRRERPRQGWDHPLVQRRRRRLVVAPMRRRETLRTQRPPAPSAALLPPQRPRRVVRPVLR